MTFAQNVYSIAKRATIGTGIRPEIVAAMAVLESNNGKSQLAQQGKNLFGIKGKGNAGSIDFVTREVVGGRNQYPTQTFAKYHTYSDSIKALINLLQKPRYKEVAKKTTLKGQAEAIAAAGYATDPNYSKAILSTYNKIKKSLNVYPSILPVIGLFFIGLSLWKLKK